MTILADLGTQRKPSETSTDGNLLLLLLEKMVVLIEQLWREEMLLRRSADADTPRQAAIRKAHQALGEWFELETLSKQGCS